MGVILLSPGNTAPEETRRLVDLAEALAATEGYAAVEVAHLRFAPPGLLDAVAQVVNAGIRRVRVVPLLLYEDRFQREHLPALVEAARRRHAGVELSVSPSLAQSPALLAAIRTLLDALAE